MPLPEIAVERVSQVAGLFLVIGALSRLGLSGWLDRHPELAYEGFARRLLATIATRMGAGPHDPVLRALLPDDTTGVEIATRDAPELEAWRVGLDRWLRRKARIGLSETVRRRGWIVADAERISVRFRLDHADIRLRRRALDIDPGWVPWLGLIVHYVYRDEPPTTAAAMILCRPWLAALASAVPARANTNGPGHAAGLRGGDARVAGDAQGASRHSDPLVARQCARPD